MCRLKVEERRASSAALIASPALTTIFTPPSDCFRRLNESIGSCAYYTEGSIEGNPSATCSLAVADSCRPPGGATALGYLVGADLLLTNSYGYSPGVLPSGYTGVGGIKSSRGIESITGCRS